MGEQSSNSVLVSLRELRKAEEDRVAAEEQADRDRELARQQAEEEAKRAAIEAQERQRQEAENRALQAQRAAEQRDREERLRLAEAERRARVEAEMRLEQHRIKAEVEAKALEKKIPWVPIGLAIGLLAMIAAGLAYYSYREAGEKELAQQKLAATQKEVDNLRQEFAERERKFQAEAEVFERQSKRLQNQLASAKTEARRDLLRKQLAARAEKKRAMAERRRAERAAERRRMQTLRTKSSGDPIGGVL